MPLAMDKPAAPLAAPKRSQASLFGGIVCGLGVFILYLLLAGGPSPLNLAIGLAVGAALGVWVRLADL
jgi:CDP-diglyceride synthetase